MSAAHRFDNALRYRAEDHPNQTALTPAYVLEPVRETLGGVIELDPCTTPDNPVDAVRFYTPPQDGAELPWDADTIYVNPPYGKARERWVRRCIEAGAEGRRVVLLIPAHNDTRVFQGALRTADALVLIQGRVKFGVLRPNRRQIAASHPSALIGWNVDLRPCQRLGFRINFAATEPRPDPALDVSEAISLVLDGEDYEGAPYCAMETLGSDGPEEYGCACEEWTDLSGITCGQHVAEKIAARLSRSAGEPKR